MRTSVRYYNCQEAKEISKMKSTQGMLDLIGELRKEVNRPFTRIDPCKLPSIRNLYNEAKTRREFKDNLRVYLGW